MLYPKWVLVLFAVLCASASLSALGDESLATRPPKQQVVSRVNGLSLTPIRFELLVYPAPPERARKIYRKRDLKSPRRATVVYNTSNAVNSNSIASCEGANGYVNRPHPGSSSASGKYGFIRGTWDNFQGYAEAYMAPESVQDEKFRQVYNGGRGAFHWNASRGCWG